MAGEKRYDPVIIYGPNGEIISEPNPLPVKVIGAEIIFTGGSLTALPAKTSVRTEANKTFIVKEASEECIKENVNRKGLSIQNIGNSICALGLGIAAKNGETIVLEPGQSWDGMLSDTLWTGAIFVIGSKPTALAIMEV